MSYLVLARKYRPKTFTEMVGQEHVVQALTNALTSQRLHHAYLFTGTRGVGKTTVSRILAKSLNCLGVDGQGGITSTPCGLCEACTAIDGGRFIDYTELDAASNRGVDEVQQLLEQAVYRPVQGRFKVFMIDEVHMLSTTAFNAMLKTLEEPPEYLKFVLATTDPQKVPVTVLSRCLQFNLRPMAPETVRAHLETVLQAEDIQAEPGALRLLAKNAHGSMRDALSLTDQAIAYGYGEIKEDQVRQMLGAVDDRYIFDLVAKLALGDGAGVIEIVNGLRQSGLDCNSTLDQMTDALHRMLVAQIKPVASSDADKLGQDELRIEYLAQQMPPDEIQLLYSICLNGKADLALTSDSYAALTMVLLRLLPFKRPIDHRVAAPPLEHIKPLVGRSEQNSKPPPEPLALKTAAAQVVSIPVRIQAEPAESSKTEVLKSRDAAPLAQDAVVSSAQKALDDLWFEQVDQLLKQEAIHALVRELALQAQLVDAKGDAWVLQVDSELLANPTQVEKLQTALRTVRPETQLQARVGKAIDTPAKRYAHAASELKVQAQEQVMNDPNVQQLMREFDADVVRDSIQPIESNEIKLVREKFTDSSEK